MKAAQERLFYPLAISALCTLALWLRWADFTWMHIDERVFVERTLGFWSGDLNPHFFNYPTLQLYLASLAQYVYFFFFVDTPVEAFIAYAYFADDHAMLAIARGLTTIMAVATVPAVAALGRRLYGTSGGLIAGFLLCILPLHVRYSHLATTDVPATLWMTLALLFAVRIIQQGRLRDFALAGICAGLTAASKYPAALIFLAIPAAAFLAKSTSRQRGLSLAISCTALSFALTSPYVLLDFKSFWQDFAGMANEHLLNRNEFALASAGPFAGLYALPTHFYYGAGLVFSIALLGAIAYRPRSWHREELVVLVAFSLFALLLAFSSSTFMRYAVPLAPLMAVLCARLFARQNLFIALAGLAVVSAEPLYASWHLHNALAGRDTRAETTAFLAQHSPQGDMILAAPGDGGRARLLSFDSVMGRKKAFLKSFGNEQLI
ncbi:MAG: 4-amino-4-deoxy-L-arabinose transferase-like glycosyltransferase, partial [Candidatus Latescibacterota bacterium]